MAILDHIAKIPGFGKRDRLIGLTDQGLQSLVKFLGLIAFARWMTVEEFAAISLAMAIMYVLTGLQRSSIVFTFIVACPDVETVEADGWKWGWLNMAAAGAATALLSLLTMVSVVSNAPGWFTSPSLSPPCCRPPPCSTISRADGCIRAADTAPYCGCP